MLKKILALTALSLLTSSQALAATGGCHAVSGTYTNRNVPCTVPALACVESLVTGDLAGVSSIVITTFNPATQTFGGTTTGVSERTGAVITSTIVGTLSGGSVQTFTGGTRQFAHATGTVVTDGAGTYAGQYCLGNGGKNG